MSGTGSTISSGGYCELELVVSCSYQSYSVTVLGLKCECVSIYDYVDCCELVRIHDGCCPVHLCVLIVSRIFDDVRGERCDRRTYIPNAQSRIRRRVDM